MTKMIEETGPTDNTALARTFASLIEDGLGFVWYGGRYQRQFESDFASLVGAQHAVMCSSGSMALQVALVASGVRPNDTVAIPDFVFHAVASAVWSLGAIPFLMRTSARSLSTDIDAAVQELPTGAAVIAVHAIGKAIDVERLMKARPDLIVVEDASDAQTTTFKGQHVGRVARLATWSFTTPHNSIHTAGVGGMITTDDPKLAVTLRQLLHYGKGDVSFDPGLSPNPLPSRPGFNGMTTEFEAAVGLATIATARDAWATRRAVGATLNQQLREAGIATVEEEAGSRQNYYDVAFRLDPSWNDHVPLAMSITAAEGCGLWSYNFLTDLPWIKELLSRHGRWTSREDGMSAENARGGPVLAVRPPGNFDAAEVLGSAVRKVFGRAE
jgi:perosamine synthetase